MYEPWITSGTIVAVLTLIWRITVEIIRKNQNKEVRAIYRQNGETEITLKGHAIKDEAALIKQLGPRVRARRK